MSNTQEILIAKQEACRKQAAKVWGVAPYRVEVFLVPNGIVLRLDGQKPSTELLDQFEAHIKETAAAARRRMN
jgi:hypothetical protein